MKLGGDRSAKVEARRERFSAKLSEEESGQKLDAPYPDVTEIGAGRGDTVFDAQLSEPIDPRNEDDYREEQDPLDT